MMHGPPKAQALHSSDSCHSDDSDLDEATLLRAWDRDICRAASFHARRLHGGAVDADDLAQAARYQLLRSFRRVRISSRHYIRCLIRNAMLSLLRLEARRQDRDIRRRVEL